MKNVLIVLTLILFSCNHIHNKTEEIKDKYFTPDPFTKGVKWNDKSETYALESYPAEVYDQVKVIEVIKEFFPTPYHYSSISSSDRKMNKGFKIEINKAMKADDEVKVDEDYDL